MRLVWRSLRLLERAMSDRKRIDAEGESFFDSWPHSPVQAGGDVRLGDAEEPAEARLARESSRAMLALVRRVRRQEIERHGLQLMDAHLHACTTLDDAFRVVAGEAGALVGRLGGGLAIHRTAEHRLETVARWGEATALTPSFSSEDCRAMRHGRTHAVVDRTDAGACGHFSDRARPGTVCVGIRANDEPFGVLCISGPGPGSPACAVNPRLAVEIGEVIRRSLAHLCALEDLRQQAGRDALTGLYNRRSLDELLARELARWHRRPFPMCLAMLDVDRFKSINDTFGHLAGDALLRRLGRLLEGATRDGDIVCRYGGDEFVIVFSGASLADSRQRVAGICSQVEEQGRSPGGGPRCAVTLSAGVAQVRARASTPALLMEAADRALYASKSAGRGSDQPTPARRGRVGTVARHRGRPNP